MNKLKTIWLWIVYSSENANNYSLAVKGFLGVAASIALLWAGIFHFTLSTEAVTTLTDAIMNAVNASFMALSYVVTAVSAWAFVWGVIRKIGNTMIGTNAVLEARK